MNCKSLALATLLAALVSQAHAQVPRDAYTEYCESLATLAETIMSHKQAGYSNQQIETTWGIHGDEIVRAISKRVQNTPVVLTIKVKTDKVVEFREEIRDSCKTAFGIN